MLAIKVREFEIKIIRFYFKQNIIIKRNIINVFIVIIFVNFNFFVDYETRLWE